MINEKSAERRKHCVLAVVRRSQKILPHRQPPSRSEVGHTLQFPSPPILPLTQLCQFLEQDGQI